MQANQFIISAFLLNKLLKQETYNTKELVPNRAFVEVREYAM